MKPSIRTVRGDRSNEFWHTHQSAAPACTYIFAPLLHSTLHLGLVDGVCVVSPAMTPELASVTLSATVPLYTRLLPVAVTVMARGVILALTLAGSTRV